MTFSLIARDPRTGAFGMVVSSSSPAVASRCVHLAAGVGAVASQNVTNPQLGSTILQLLASGGEASSALRVGLATDAHAEYRQVAAVDGEGRTAIHTGARGLGITAHAVGEAAVAAGNMLAAPDVPERMLDAYAGSSERSFEERLLSSLRAGAEAGGELGPVRSAGLAVIDTMPWRSTDLRVDDHDIPIDELGRLLRIWLPQKQAYLTRAIDPGAAPSFGVPGDR